MRCGAPEGNLARRTALILVNEALVDAEVTIGEEKEVEQQVDCRSGSEGAQSAQGSHGSLVSEACIARAGGRYSFHPLRRCWPVIALCSLAVCLFSSTSAAQAASIGEESVLNVSGDSATFRAQVSPEGADVKYHFEYDTSEYASDKPHGKSIPLLEGDTGISSQSVTIEADAQDLTPSTLYHYRVVISSAGITGYGRDQTFTTEPTGSQLVLPDNRSWELTSPSDKGGATVEPLPSTGGVIQASEDGSQITYLTRAPVGTNIHSNPAPNYTQVMSTRLAQGGWFSEDIATTINAPSGVATGTPNEYFFFSENLSGGLLELPRGDNTSLPPLSEGAEKTIYIREVDGVYLPLVTTDDATSGEKFGERITFAGATPNLNHVILSSGVPLTKGNEVKGEGLYEWEKGVLKPVSVLPNEEAAENTPLLGEGGHNVRNAVATDGSRVIWSERGGGEHLYIRDMSRGETIQLDAVEAGASGGSAARGARFQIASGNGSRVFFTDEARLTTDSTAEEREPDLYMFEVTNSGGPLAGKLTDLSVDRNQPANIHGSVIGVGEDESSKEVTSVYFVASGVLAGNENSHKEQAEAGANNLYVDSLVGNRWTPSFIANLSNEDSNDWGAEAEAEGFDLDKMTSRVSPNGEYLAFMSDKSLTGYDNRDASSGEADEEVFLYSADTGGLICASCNPTGARPTGLFDTGAVVEEGLLAPLVDKSEDWRDRWLAANVPGWTQSTAEASLYQSRYLSNDGRLFFNSSDALVPQQIDGLENVYEYEPSGIGSCSQGSTTFSNRSGGCVSLISSGEAAGESAFVDASETGNDVFFVTNGELVSEDNDAAYDVYDAHVCTSVAPCQVPSAVSSPPCTTEDSCRASSPPQPEIFGPPASQTFSGVGNISPLVKKPKPRSRSLTRSQKLSKALQACKRERRERRASCESRARKRYGARKKKAGRQLGHATHAKEMS
jgi:hypothetical protein